MQSMIKTSVAITAAAVSDLLIWSGDSAAQGLDPFGASGKLVGTIALIVCLWWVIKLQLTEKKKLQAALDTQARHDRQFLEELNQKNTEAFLGLTRALRDRPCLYDLDGNRDPKRRED